MSIPIQETIKRDYERPAMRVYEVKYRVNLMAFSRTNYSKGGDGYSDSGMSGRYGYDDGDDGFSDSGMSGRYGYDDGGDGFY